MSESGSLEHTALRAPDASECRCAEIDWPAAMHSLGVCGPDAMLLLMHARDTAFMRVMAIVDAEERVAGADEAEATRLREEIASLEARLASMRTVAFEAGGVALTARLAEQLRDRSGAPEELADLRARVNAIMASRGYRALLRVRRLLGRARLHGDWPTRV